MKKIDILQLVASLFLLFGSVLGLIDLFVEFPLWLTYTRGGFLCVSSVLYGVLLIRLIKRRKK